MKSFRVYLAESVKTYSYKIKVAGDCPKNWLTMFCANLQKFDPVKISEPKTTPIQKEPYGFPGLTNQQVSIIDVEFKYPATEPMIKQLAKLLNYDENLVIMVQSKADDSFSEEAKQFENQMQESPVLEKEELADAGKEASKDYADQYMTKIAKQAEKDKIEMKFAGEKTKPAEDTRKAAGNTKSPFSSVSRMPKPNTGSTKA